MPRSILLRPLARKIIANVDKARMGPGLLCRIMGGLQTGKGMQVVGWDIQS